MRAFHDFLNKIPSPGSWYCSGANLNCLPNDTAHVPGIGGDSSGVLELALF
jgi:hypothetical protein